MAVIHLDAGVLIGFLDDTDAHHVASVEVVAEALRDSKRLAMAASALAECLVAPSRAGEGTVAAFRRVVERLPVDVVPIDADIAAGAAMLRATHPSLRLPDALVIAAARATGASLVTTDARWPVVGGVDIRVIHP